MGELFLLVVLVALPMILIAPFPARARAIVSVLGAASIYVILLLWETGPDNFVPMFVAAIGVGFALNVLVEAARYAGRHLKRRIASHG